MLLQALGDHRASPDGRLSGDSGTADTAVVPRQQLQIRWRSNIDYTCLCATSGDDGGDAAGGGEATSVAAASSQLGFDHQLHSDRCW
jgi:hypothetical protein